MKFEEMLEKHRPRHGTEDEPASKTQLELLNINGLLASASDAQLEKDGWPDPTDLSNPVTKLTAWEVLSGHQRAGRRLRFPQDLKRRNGHTSRA